jgi:predicted aconitase
VEHITPEAVHSGDSLLLPGHKTYRIDDQELVNIRKAYPLMWVDSQSAVQKCLIGCPHLSLQELSGWVDKIERVLHSRQRSVVAVPTLLAAAPQVISAFQKDTQAWNRMRSMGIQLSPTCFEAYMQNPLVEQEAIVTNSNKLRHFTRARYLPENGLLEVIAGDPLQVES